MSYEKGKGVNMKTEKLIKFIIFDVLMPKSHKSNTDKLWNMHTFYPTGPQYNRN